MRILIVTQYYWPEDFRINDICKSLKEQGHEVEVMTGMPNYPEGKIYEGYSNLKLKTIYKDGIKIMRVPMVARGKNSSIKLGLNYISYMITGTIKALTLVGKKYDRVFVFQVSPITSAIPAIIISKLKKIDSYIYIQDLWPETFYSIKNIGSPKIRRIMKKTCIKIYNSFDNLLIASEGYEKILVENKIEKDKIKYFPQWAEDFYSNIEIKKIEENEEFIVTFAGNIGKAQSVETIIEAANLAKNNKKIIWQILGDGSELENIKRKVSDYKLEETVKILGRKPSIEMPKYFSESDGLIVTLKSEEILKVTLPAKVQSYMASGKPILASISGEGKRVIEKSESGLVNEAENYKGLYENVIILYNMTSKERKMLGENGKKFFEENFKKEKLLKDLNRFMNLRSVENV